MERINRLSAGITGTTTPAVVLDVYGGQVRHRPAPRPRNGYPEGGGYDLEARRAAELARDTEVARRVAAAKARAVALDRGRS